MRGTDSDPRLPKRLHKLLYWLANEDVYTSDYVRGWLERMPPREVADDLLLIATYAQPEPHSLWHAIWRGVIMLLATTDSVSETGPAGRKAGTRAALLLANRNDPHAVAPLVRVFEPQGMWTGRYQNAIEAALHRLLSNPVRQSEVLEYADALRTLIAKIRRSAGKTDLSSSLADLLIAALRHLRTASAEQDAALLNSIAAEQTTKPNLARVQRAAIVLRRQPGDSRDPGV